MSFFLSFLLSLSYFLTIDSGPPGSSPLKDQQVVPRNRDSGTRGKICGAAELFDVLWLVDI